MQVYDVFNGDADGVCALLQLRLAEPQESVLITGVKRDISLVQQVPVTPPAKVNVLDLSLKKNCKAVDELLAADSHVFYVDHHAAGETLPQHPKFRAIIDTSPNTCTSLLIDHYLGGRFRNWAITAAFGDNLNGIAEVLAIQAGLSSQQTNILRELGTYINYNSYGASLNDLHFHPAQLYIELSKYSDPFDFIITNKLTYEKLKQGYKSDLKRGLSAVAISDTSTSLVVSLPDAPWARRISGALANELANKNPNRSCAIITERPNGTWLASIRAPLQNCVGADMLARRFPTGGGREGAAGINALPANQLNDFIQLMEHFWSD